MSNHERTELNQMNQIKFSYAFEKKDAKTSFFKWCLIGCLLMGISGGVRAWQDSRFATVEMEGQKCPFDLKDLPTTLGNVWQLQEGGEKELDDQVKRVAGCSDSLIRSYRNSTTGVSLTVLIRTDRRRASRGMHRRFAIPLQDIDP